jgi:NADH-quinone oxidoreductase subunit C
MTDETATDTTADDASTEVVPAEDVPRDERREALLGEITEVLGDAVVASHITPGHDLCVRVTPDAWALTAEVVRLRLGARYFCFLSAIDWMPSPFGRSMDAEVDRVLAVSEAGSEAGSAEAASEVPAGFPHGTTGGDTRFQLLARVAHVGEPGNYWGITLKADVPDDTATIDTWTNTYAGADWHERETWEMFGITFAGHPGLRNMYLPSAFEGHPLRKDFPLLARMVKPWPGIVDVEPMPTDDAEGDGES